LPVYAISSSNVSEGVRQEAQAAKACAFCFKLLQYNYLSYLMMGRMEPMGQAKVSVKYLFTMGWMGKAKGQKEILPQRRRGRGGLVAAERGPTEA
jgi:hypothetical protein